MALMGAYQEERLDKAERKQYEAARRRLARRQLDGQR
jgi:hypothetical protein